MKQTLIALAAVSALLASPALAIAQTAVTTDTFTAAGPTDVLSSNLIGLNVVNSQNETVGEIKDLILSQGQLSGYILSVGGFLGMGERYVIVRPAAINIAYVDADSKWKASMNATVDQLKAAPAFTYEGRWKR